MWRKKGRGSAETSLKIVHLRGRCKKEYPEKISQKDRAIKKGY